MVSGMAAESAIKEWLWKTLRCVWVLILTRSRTWLRRITIIIHIIIIIIIIIIITTQSSTVFGQLLENI